MRQEPREPTISPIVVSSCPRKSCASSFCRPGRRPSAERGGTRRGGVHGRGVHGRAGMVRGLGARRQARCGGWGGSLWFLWSSMS